MTKQNAITRPVAIAENMAAEYIKRMENYLDGLDFGTTEASAEDARAFVAMMIQENPPMIWTSPDGRVEVGSSWIINLREKHIDEPKGAWKSVMETLESMKTASPRRDEMKPQRTGVM